MGVWERGRAIIDNYYSVIFIRDKNSRGQEVSGYIDYAHRLKTEDFEVYFSGKKRLLPRPTDMSFYNWDSHIAVWNSTPNYQVIADNPEGLLFKYKRDRKILNVDPKIPGISSIQLYVISSQFCLKRAVIRGIASQLQEEEFEKREGSS
ncbi:hypothetical protein JEQ12_017551 [Ovis aries]|uniref:Cilia- and flagella-associated protein 299 n=1 Tax=Ovis aries TaxID=9940 RepID=A0A836A291_SHEEP|nr:hypothetical protein JEQ12_017551 [Ovis aries]